MKHKPAIYALVRLHAEIAGRLEANQQEAVKLRANLRHVQAVIHLFEPDYNLKSIVPRKRQVPNRLFKRQECLHLALDVLREAQTPLSARQIALLVIGRRGVSEPSTAVVIKTTNTIYMAMKGRRGKSVAAHDGFPIRWSLLP